MLARQTADQRHESGSPIQQCEGVFHPVGPHRHFAAIDPIGDLTVAAPAVSIRQRFLRVLTTAPGPLTSSTLRAYSRTSRSLASRPA